MLFTIMLLSFPYALWGGAGMWLWFLAIQTPLILVLFFYAECLLGNLRWSLPLPPPMLYFAGIGILIGIVGIVLALIVGVIAASNTPTLAAFARTVLGFPVAAGYHILPCIVLGAIKGLSHKRNVSGEVAGIPTLFATRPDSLKGEMIVRVMFAFVLAPLLTVPTIIVLSSFAHDLNFIWPSTVGGGMV